MRQPQEITELPSLPPRSPDGHKGTYGKVLVVAGSRGMSGAAILCGMGALRGGAGLVQVAVPGEILPIVAGCNPSYLTAGLPSEANGLLSRAAEESVLELTKECNVVAVGPGLGRSDAIVHLVKKILAEAVVPVVLDADGLNVLATILPYAIGHQTSSPLVLTPHPGEFARLVGADTAQIKHRRRELAVAFAEKLGAVVVLKGNRTLVTDADRIYQNTTGNAGMATGGTGDVLTGLIAALIAQGMPAFAAAQLGVYLHGLAGDLARDRLGECALIATDVVESLPQAFLALG